MAPVVAPSTIGGGAPVNLRSASYSARAAVRQSKQPTRTRAWAASRRGCRFGAGFDAGGFGGAHPATPTRPTRTTGVTRHNDRRPIRSLAIRGGHAGPPLRGHETHRSPLRGQLDTDDGETAAGM